MHLKSIGLTSVLILGLIWSCGITETDPDAAIEDAIRATIAADNDTYGIEGMADTDDAEFSLEKTNLVNESGSTSITEMDSSYIWKFGRRAMNTASLITVLVEDDSSAVSLISHHITGLFLVRQFERIWIDGSTWIRGDSVRFSQKAIDMNVERRVAFRKRLSPSGQERWIATAMTLAYGTSGDALGIESMEWVAEDTVRVFNDFESVFYTIRNPFNFALLGTNQMNAIIVNDIPGEAERVDSRRGHNSHPTDPNMGNRFHFQYIGMMSTGAKIYSRPVLPSGHPLRQFDGVVEVIDQRTLFDHDYPAYSAASLEFIHNRRFPVNS